MTRVIMLLTAIFIISSNALPIEQNTLRYYGFTDDAAENYENRPRSYVHFQKNVNDFRRLSYNDKKNKRKEPETTDALFRSNSSNKSFEASTESTNGPWTDKKPGTVDDLFKGRQGKRSIDYKELYEKLIELGMKYLEVLVIVDASYQTKE